MSPDPEPTLQRFLDAQEAAYPTALAEIQRGRKQSHWMWYIFPQLQGLGYSPTAHHYGLRGAPEARAYAQHPVLGARLVEISQALLALPGDSATRVLGSPDDVKLRSSMTLFAALPGADPVFQQVLDKFFSGQADPLTLRLLGSAPAAPA
jgi:uncharacterized protein (DUF1810 family)